jgi:hypothetical protein
MSVRPAIRNGAPLDAAELADPPLREARPAPGPIFIEA